MSGYESKSSYPPCHIPQKDGGCHIGNVEQQNAADVEQTASISQQVNQSNFFIVFCGAAAPANTGFSFSPTDKANFELKENGDMILNGKTIKGEQVSDGVKMYVLKETKIKNQKYGNSTPEDMHERVEGFKKNMMENYQEEDYAVDAVFKDEAEEEYRPKCWIY